jgi:predicted DCC family thiol-disulfide oxidoreductase YuxK
MITVFYDGKCGLCRREIEHYKSIAPKTIFDKPVFEWVDITIMPDPFLRRGYSVKQGLKALHVEDEKGKMHVGVAAFAIIWQVLPKGWPMLAVLVKLPFIMPLAQKIYDMFAAWRYKKLGYETCDL